MSKTSETKLAKAWVWASGLIEILPADVKARKGSLLLIAGPLARIKPVIEVHARHGYDGKNSTRSGNSRGRHRERKA